VKALSRSGAPAETATDDGLAAAPDVPPQATEEGHAPEASVATAEPTVPTEAERPVATAPAAPDAAQTPREVVAVEVERPAAVAVTTSPVDDHEATDEAAPSDPDAPTQPVERAAAAWPRPIETRNRAPDQEDPSP
jgi:hypothetical protein